MSCPLHASPVSSCAGCGEAELLLRIESELQAALEVSPSPQFVPRVRQRMAETVPTAWWARSWRPSLAAVVVVAAAGTAFLLRRAPVPVGPSPVPVGRQQAAAPPPGPGVSSAVGQPARATAPVASAPRGRRPPPARPSAEPEVLVPAGQEALLGQLVAGMARSREMPAWLVVAEATSEDEEETRGLDLPLMDVPPLAIAPLGEE